MGPEKIQKDYFAICLSLDVTFCHFLDLHAKKMKFTVKLYSVI